MTKPFNPNDAYARKAKSLGYLARSAFKLEDILKKFSILKPGNRVLDIGAAPGSWLQVISKKIGAKGLAVGIDISEIKFKSNNIKIIKGDIFEKTVADEIAAFAPFDAIVSDIAPKTSGIKIRDQAQSEELVNRVLEIARAFLKKGGSLAVKIFQGSDTRILIKEMRKTFKKVSAHKPPASRDRSFETYLVGLDKID